MIKRVSINILAIFFIIIPVKADILSDSDKKNYREVFALQQEGRFVQANKIAKKLIIKY